METTKDLRADIVVIGAGAAGLGAAAAAVEAGIKDILVLEVRKNVGGNGNFVLGCMGIESHIQKYLGIVCRKDEIFKGLMTYSHWRGNAALVSALVDKTTTLIQWLEDKGVEWGGLFHHYPGQTPRAHHYTKGDGTTGGIVLKALRKFCGDHGVRFMTETRGRRLLTDEKGNVSGVLADSKGEELKISTKSVVIATGGIQGNSELIAESIRSYKPEEFQQWGLPHMGDGVLMAAEIGGAREGQIVLDGMQAPMFAGARKLNLICVAYDPSTLWVNKMGKRFVNENVVWWFSEAGNALYRQPGKMCYSLFDESTRQHVLKEGFTEFYESAARITAVSSKGVKEEWLSTADENFQKEDQEGNLKISDSLDEIARFIGADPEVFKSTVDVYNSGCDRGHDGVFAKDREFLRPLRNPPYYAMKCVVGLMGVSGDLRVDERMHVLNEEYMPIGGLYAAGSDTAFQDGDTYNVYLTGHAFGFSLCGGRIAAEDAARYISEKQMARSSKSNPGGVSREPMSCAATVKKPR